MAVNRWVGKQLKQVQVNLITVGGTPANNQTYSVTTGSKVITYTATGADTNITIAAALLVLLKACAEPEFTERTFAASGTLAITDTSNTAGYPFTSTSASSGTGTLVTTTPTANKSPSDWGDAANFSAGSLPVNGDDIYIDNTSIPILWNLSALSAVKPNSVTIAQSFSSGAPGNGGGAPGNLSGTIGLPDTNTIGTAYTEYRPSYLQFAGIGTGLCSIGTGQGVGSGRIKLDVGSVATSIYVYNTGSPLDSQLPAVIIKGTSASNTLVVDGGSVGVAIYGGDTSNLSGGIKVGAGGGVNAATAPTLVLGAGVTWATMTQEGGTVQWTGAGTTFTQYAGTANSFGTGALTTANVGGTFYPQSTGTIGTLALWSGGTADFTLDTQGRTITNCTVYGNHTINDPGKSVTWTNGIAGASGVDPIADGKLVLGKGRTVTAA